MIKIIKTNKKKGFTLIELIVVMAVIGILVLLAVPKFLGHTKEAQFTKHISNAKVLEEASNRYYLDHGKWPRGADEDAYTPEEVASYAERIYDITGKELTLEEGNYWDIDYDALSAYAKLPDKSEQANYVLRNPVGKVYYLEGLTEEGAGRLERAVDTGRPDESSQTDEINNLPYEEWVSTLEAKGYVMATNKDFVKKNGNGQDYWGYVGDYEYVIIPHQINGEKLTNYFNMFLNADVKGVASKNQNITSMEHMFWYSPSTELDLRFLNTSNVTNMRNMFGFSKATILDLGSFDTSKTVNMSQMFWGSEATFINLISFNTSQVTNMRSMFYSSDALLLDLSSFDTSNVKNLSNMFYQANATTGYARTKTDANRFNNSTTYKPSTLTFTVKP